MSNARIARSDGFVEITPAPEIPLVYLLLSGRWWSYPCLPPLRGVIPLVAKEMYSEVSRLAGMPKHFSILLLDHVFPEWLAENHEFLSAWSASVHRFHATDGDCPRYAGVRAEKVFPWLFGQYETDSEIHQRARGFLVAAVVPFDQYDHPVESDEDGEDSPSEGTNVIEVPNAIADLIVQAFAVSKAKPETFVIANQAGLSSVLQREGAHGSTVAKDIDDDIPF